MIEVGLEPGTSRSSAPMRYNLCTTKTGYVISNVKLEYQLNMGKCILFKQIYK